MGVIILDPDGIVSAERKVSLDASVEACGRDGKTRIVLSGEVIAEFDEYDDAVIYLRHIDPWAHKNGPAQTE